MKHRWHLGALLACATLCAGPALSAEPSIDPGLREGMVLHFSFDQNAESASDKSGKGNDGALRQAAFAPEGRYGGGCLLNGQGAHIRVPNSKSLAMESAVTVAVWVKLRSLNPKGYGNEHGYIINRGHAIWWDPGFSLGFEKGSGIPRFEVIQVGHGKGKGCHLYGGTPIKPGRWTHLLGTYDGAETRLYVNGCLEASTAYSGKLQDGGAPVLIGGASLIDAEFGNHFTVDAVVDEVMIWDRALDDAEVRSLVLGVPLKVTRDAYEKARVDRIVRQGGEVLEGAVQDGRLAMKLPGGKATLPLAEVRSLAPIDKEEAVYRVVCANGSRLTGILDCEGFRLKPKEGPEVLVPAKELLWLARAVGLREDAPATTLELQTGDRISGRITTTALSLKTDQGEFAIHPDSVASMEPVPDKPPSVTLKLWDGSTRQGQLVTQKLIVVVGGAGADIEVNLDAVVSLKRSKATPPPELLAQIERLVKQLGADAYPERRAATAALIAMGKGICPILEGHADIKDPKIGMRLRDILEELRREPEAPAPPPMPAPPEIF